MMQDVGPPARGPAILPALAWFAVLLSGAAVGLVTTEGHMGAPPSAWGLLALAAVVVMLLASALLLERWDAQARPRPSGHPPRRARIRQLRRALLLGTLGVALALVAAQDFLRPGITYGHDIPHHAWALWSLWRCVLDGDWFPRWNPYLSLGIPLLQFYAPLPYIAAWPAQALGASPTQALAWLSVLGQLATAASLYGCARWLGGSRSAGLLAGFAGVLGPYHLMDQTFRLALGETMAFGLIAPFLVASWRIARGERGLAPWVLGASAAALLLTHLLTLFMCVALGGALAVVALFLPRSQGPRRMRRAAIFAVTVVLTLGATAAFWLPVAAEVQHTAVGSISRPGAAISPYAALPDEPLRRRLWPRYDVRRPHGEGEHPGLGMPMYFGVGLLALLGLALLAPRSRLPSDSPAPDPRPFAVAALVALLLALDPFARALDGLPLLGRIMFPWRLYAPATVLAALAGGLAFDRYWTRPGVSRAAGLLAAAVLLAWDVSPYLGAAQRFDDHEGLGLVEFRGDRPVVVQGIPRGEFVRIEDARLPPSDYEWRIALSRRAFPEYMNDALRRRYGRSSAPPSREVSEELGVAFRVRAGHAAPEALNPLPLLSFAPEGAAFAPLADAGIDILPEHVQVALPPGLPAGRLRLSMTWFPGWRASVDGASADAAPSQQSLLAVALPAGAGRVDLRYSAVHPWDRSAGLLLSGLTLVGILAAVARRRRVPAEDRRRTAAPPLRAAPSE